MAEPRPPAKQGERGEGPATGDMNRRLFGELIRNIRSAAALTQAEMAALTEVSPGTVSRWERGVCCGRLITAWLIERIFQLSPLQLCGEEEILNLENLAKELLEKRGIKKAKPRRLKRRKK